MKDENKTYIGDGVYAEFTGYDFILTTENGYEATNTIHMEPDMIRALDRFMKNKMEAPQEQK